MELLEVIFSQWTLYLSAIVYLLYKWSMVPYKFFLEKGIAYKKPLPVFGNLGAMTLRYETMHDTILNAYNEFSDKRFFGLYDFSRPLLTIRDPELIRQITVKDFEYFLDHRQFFLDEDQEPLFGKSLFMLKGQKWRDMRATLSPAFTGSKMRQMFQLIVDCAKEAQQILLKEAKASAKSYVPEMKDIFTRIANDVIATTAFGIQVNSLQNPENAFYKMGKKSTSFAGIGLMLKIIMISALPKISKTLRLRFFSKEMSQFYGDLVHNTIKHREKEGIIRYDMINLLIEARKGGSVSKENDNDTAGFATVEEVSDENLKGRQKRVWEDDDLTAQCFLFFLGGFETISTLLCFVAQELTENQDVQVKLREEIDEVNEQLNGKSLSYDALQKMKYMDMVISETLRKWPPAVVVDRSCRKQYEITDENGRSIQIKEGEDVWIPIYGIHRDPAYYPNPDKFDPERFNDKNKLNIKPFTYLPFGAGPRNCIGSRFALMEAKALIFYLLTAFTFEVAANTQIPLKLARSGFSIKSEKGFNIHLKPRN